MKVQIEVPDFEGALYLNWEPGFKISAKMGMGNNVIISSNRAGLISMARHLLLLAQPAVSIGHHYHFDSSNSLEKGSVELIIEKIE